MTGYILKEAVLPSLFNRIEYMKTYHRDLYLNNKEYYNNQSKEYYLKNKDNLTIYKKKHGKEYHFKLRSKILEKLNNKCSNPYNINHGDFLNDIRCLQIDHINGGGVKEVKKMNGMSKYYNQMLSLSEEELKIKYQLLCANCNWIKRHENNEVRKRGI